METIFGIIAALIFALYTAIVIKKTGGIPYSISETYYRLENPKWFSICMGLVGFTFFGSAIGRTPDTCQFLVFLSLLGVLIIALSPRFKEKTEGVIHYTGTAILFLSSQTWVACTNPWLLLIWLLPLIYIIRHVIADNIKTDLWSKIVFARPAFWLEITGFFILLFNLLLL